MVGFACIFIGLSIPRFGRILNFVGASAISVQSFVLPPLFYILLVRKEQVINAQSLVLGLRRPSDGKVLNITFDESESNSNNSQQLDERSEFKTDKRNLINRRSENNLDMTVTESRRIINLDFITKVEMNLYLKIGLIAVMFMGIFVGITASAFSLMDLFDPKTFIVPCYVKDCNVNDKF